MNSRKFLRRLWKPGLLSLYWRVIVRPHWGYVLGVFSLMFMAGLFEMVTVGLGIPLIEAATRGAGESQNPVVQFVARTLPTLGFSVRKENLIFSLLIIVTLTALLKAAFLMVYKTGTDIISQLLKRETKEKLFRKMMYAKYEYLSRRSRGAIIYDINYPAQSLYHIITYLGNMVSNTLSACLLVGMMVYISPVATITIGIVGGGWLYGARRFLAPRLGRIGKKIYELNQFMSKVDVDAIDGIRVVKSHALAPKLIDIQHKILTDELYFRKRGGFATQGLNFANEMAAGFVLIVLGTLSFGLGWFQLPFSRLVVLLLAVRRVAPAVSTAASSYLQLNLELKSVQVLDDVLSNTPQEKGGRVEIENVGFVTLNNVEFSYSTEKSSNWSLKNINIKMAKGEVTAIVGPTGAGKSTLANILMGFYQPTRGDILINQYSLKSLDLSHWRKKIGYVSQDVFLFNESIRQNVVLWNENISEEQILDALREAQLYDFVQSLPEGLDTSVGDRGVKLSGGQAQRLAIARAILHCPEVLIFDEATSALDNLTEKAVYEAIHHLRKNAIVLVIAHRLSTVKDADTILVLDRGNLVELGTHEKLIEHGGVYARLYREGELTTSTASFNGTEI